MEISTIKLLSDHNFEKILHFRRFLHMHPELSFEEKQTAAFISQQLKSIGIPFQKMVEGHGIVAVIQGRNASKRTVALRADMDALPIQELNQHAYASVNTGVMHACGHDVHMACLLGAAMILDDLKDEFEGTVKLIFQPAEELYPGGAKAMIEAGVLKNPDVDFIIGQHVIPIVDAGKIGIRSGMIMASADEIYIKLTGKGGHAATPDLTSNPIPVASRIIVELLDYLETHKPTDSPTILSFGKFVAEGSMNVVPPEVNIAGTFRAFNDTWRDQMLQVIDTRVNELSKQYGVTCDVKICRGYPSTNNDDALTKQVRDYAIEYLGAENVEEVAIRLTAEDFAYYAQEVPACFYRLGIRNESKGISSNLHTATFDVDEESLRTGMGLMAWITLQLINN